MKTLTELERAYDKALLAARRIISDRAATLDQVDRAEAKRDAAQAAWLAAKAGK